MCVLIKRRYNLNIMEERIWQIISAKLSDEELSQTEEEIFEKWINAHPNNLEIYTRFTDFIHSQSDVHLIDTSKAYNLVIGKIRRRTHSLRRLLIPAVAASVVLALFLTVPGRKSNRQTPPLLTQEIRGYDLYSSNDIILTAQDRVFIINPAQEGRINTTLFSAFINNEGTLVCSPAKPTMKMKNKNQLSAINKNIRINVPYGKDLKVLLPDRSTVTLNAGTNLTFEPCMGTGNRKVMLDGEGYFNVAKNKELPFIVETANLTIKVTGTLFNIKAYPVQCEVFTTLQQGEVKVSRKNGSGKEHVLQPNQQHIFNLFTGEEDVKEVDAFLYTAWADKIFSYKNTTLDEVMKDLYRWHRLKYEFEDDQAHSVKISARIEKTKDIDSIMMLLERVNKVEISKTNNIYHIKTKR